MPQVLPTPVSEGPNWGTMLNGWFRQIGRDQGGGLHYWENATRPSITGKIPGTDDSVDFDTVEHVGLTGINTELGIIEKWDGSDWIVLMTGGSGGGTAPTSSTDPAGNNTQIQFNDSGIFGASADFVWDNTNSRLGINTIPQKEIDINGDAQISGNLTLGSYTLPNTDGTTGQILKTDGNGVVAWSDDDATSAGINNIIEDTTPQLGGDLDINGFKITSANDSNIEITPAGTGGVGIGTSIPNGILDVQGDQAFLPAPAIEPIDDDFSNSQWSLWLDETNDEFELKAKKSDGTVISQTVGSGGVAPAQTTASNMGASGFGVFIQKTDSNLEFKNIDSGSTKIIVSEDALNHLITIDVDEAELALNNLGEKDYSSLENKPLDDNFHSLTLENTVEDDDEILIYDTSAGEYKKIQKTLLNSSTAPTTPAGNSNEIQFNDSGSFAASGNFVWDNVNENLGIGIATPTEKLEVFGDIKLGTGTQDLTRSIKFERNSLETASIDSISSGLSLQAKENTSINFLDTLGNGFILADGGNVGIGTSAPNGILDVQGDQAFLPAPAIEPAETDFSNSQWSLWLDETNDEFELKAKKSDGTVISQTVGAGGVGGTAEPAGSNYQIQFNDNGNFAGDSGLNWRKDNQRLGIGTASPGRQVEVRDTASFSALRLRGYGIPGIYSMLELYSSDYDTTSWDIRHKKGSTSEHYFSINYQNSTALSISPKKDFGIGRSDALSRFTATGGAAFDATGTVSIDATITVTGVGTAFRNELGIGATITIGGESKRVIAIDSDTSLRVESAFATMATGQTMSVENSIFRIDDGGGVVRIIADKDGNLGISTRTPQEKLDVSGTVRADLFKSGDQTGVSGTFTTTDGKTITITNGIVTGVVSV